MARSNVGAVEIVGLGPVAVATTLWRSFGILRATAVVKATFDFVPGGAMTIAESTRLVGVEAHHAGNPMRSIRASSELSPFLPKADVLFVGQAYPPGGVPSPRSTVRLALLRNDWALVDKTLTVTGDRATAELEPAPFQRMPVVYERAFGGLGHAENPLGTGVEPAKGRSLPNFAYAAGEHAEPAGFGPISWSWPARRRRLRGYSRKLLSEPLVELPDGFDLEFFQAAPPDQRTTYLRGDEVLVLEGLHPSYPRLEMALPGVRGAARAIAADGVEIPLTLHADTLYIDGDAEQCSVIWRGSFPVPSEEAIEGIRILAGVDSAGAPIEWPTPAHLEEVNSPAPAPDAGWEGTYALSDSNGREASSLAAPFAIPAPGASQPSANPPIPGAPWAPSKAQPPPPPKRRASLEATVTIDVDVPEADDDDDDVTLKAPLIPRRAPPPAPPIAAPVAPSVVPVAPSFAPVAPSFAPVAPSVAPARSSVQGAPAPRATPSRPALRNKLYGGFGPKKT